MLSSTDVAGLFQSQNSLFMGQNSYAQTIGVNRGGGAPSYAPAASFGSNSGGNRVAGMGMSAMGGMAQLGAGLAFDPFGAFIGGAAGAMGRGGLGAMMGGGMAAALPMMPLAIGAQMGIGSFVRGGQAQQAIGSQLGGYNFMNSGARTGQGFSRQDSQQVGDSIRQLAHIPEMMTSVEELTKLMPKLKASGVMSGVRSAQEFQSRFKEAVSTIRDMSKVLGTTMEEAEQFFAHSRSVGFTGRSGQLKNTLNAQFTSGMTGMSTGQVMQLQQAGAGMATSVGARRSLGATAVSNMAQTLGKAQQEGRLSEGALEDMTGLQGGEAIQAASQRMTEAMYNFSQRSPVGKLMMAGLAKFDKSGKATGLDEGLVRQLQSGAIGIDDLKRRAGSLTNSQKISFTHRQAGTLAMDLAGQVGVGGVGDIFQNLLGGKGTDADRLMMGRHTGLNESEVDVAMSLGGMGMGDSQGMGNMAKLRAREASFKERTDPATILKRMKTKLHSSMLGGIEQAGAQVFTDLGKQYDAFIDEVVGRHIVTLSKEGTASLQKAMSGGSRKEMNEMFAAASGLKAESASSRQFGFGDALTLGSQGMGAMFTQGGRSAIGKLTTGSEFLAKLQFGGTSSGRDAIGRQRRGEELIGGLDAARALDSGSGLDAAGRASMGGARDVVRGLRAGIDNFRDMDPDKRLDQLRGSIHDQIFSGLARSGEVVNDFNEIGDTAELEARFGGKAGVEKKLREMENASGPFGDTQKNAAKLLRAGIAGGRGGAKDFYTGIVGGTKGLGGSMAGALGSADATDQFYGVKAAAKLNERAEAGLKDAGLSDGTINLIKSNPGAKKALNLAMSDEAVRDAIESGDIDALKAKGISVGPNDIEALKKGLDDIDKAGTSGKSKITAAFGDYESARKSGDLVAIQGAFRDTAGEINENIRGLGSAAKGEGTKALQGVADAMAKFSSGKGDGKANFEAVGSSISALSAAIANEKDPEKKQKLIAAGGAIGEAIGGAQRVAGGLKGKVSQEDLLKKFGLAANDQGAKDMLSRAGVLEGSGGVIGAGVDVKDLANKVAGYKGMGSVAAGKAEMAGETSLPKTLSKLDKTLDVQNTILVAIGNKLEADMSGTKIVERSQDGMNEKGASK